MLTTPGTLFASRVGASLIRALKSSTNGGAAENSKVSFPNCDFSSLLVTKDITEYEERAVQIATNSTLWQNLHVYSIVVCGL